MKDETIRAGDLVMVVRGFNCCGWAVSLGKTYIVTSIDEEGAEGRCMACRKWAKDAPLAMGFNDHQGMPIYTLKKIHPPELPESVDERQEVEA